MFELNEDHLKQAFAKYGEVESAHVARDPRGMSKGYVGIPGRARRGHETCG